MLRHIHEVAGSRPAIAAGDWNVTPAQLRLAIPHPDWHTWGTGQTTCKPKAGIEEATAAAPGTVPTLPRELDYFVLNSAGHLLISACTILITSIATHRVVAARLTHSLGQTLSWFRRKPKPPTAKVTGPHWPEPTRPTTWEHTPTPDEKYHLWNTEVQKTLPGLLGVEGIRDPAPRILPTKLHTAIDILRNRDPTHVAEHRARNILQQLDVLGATTTKTAYTEHKLALLAHPWVRGNRALTKAVQTTPHGMFPKAHWARGLLTRATIAVEEARATRTARWQTFLDTELTKGAGFQHKWTKPTQEQPDHTISLEEELEKTRAQWATYWEERDHTLAAPNLQWPTIAPASTLDATDLRRAAKTFSPKSSAICGWHPRTLGCLGEAHLPASRKHRGLPLTAQEHSGPYASQTRLLGKAAN
jgi:hypothetical protein